MMRVEFSPISRQDLVGIGDFIAQDSRKRARSFVAELRAACEALDHDPLRFPLHPELASQGIRKRPVGSYTILYQVRADGEVWIVRVVHAARDVKSLGF